MILIGSYSSGNFHMSDIGGKVVITDPQVVGGGSVLSGSFNAKCETVAGCQCVG